MLCRAPARLKGRDIDNVERDIKCKGVEIKQD